MNKLLLSLLCVMLFSCTSAYPNKEVQSNSQNQDFRNKIESIVFPKIEFSNVPAGEAVAFIIEQSAVYCPNKEGFSIIVDRTAVNLKTRVNFTGTNVNTLEVLNMLSYELNCYWRTGLYGIDFSSKEKLINLNEK